MANAQETLTALLKDAGYSATRVRRAVFEALLRQQQPISMAELVASTPVDRASVYRAVELFEQLHIVQRINTGWKYKLELSDRFTEHHHHLTCTQCEQIIAINEQAMEQFIEQVAARAHFTPTSHQLEIQGLCDSCVKQQRKRCD